MGHIESISNKKLIRKCAKDLDIEFNLPDDDYPLTTEERELLIDFHEGRRYTICFFGQRDGQKKVDKKLLLLLPITFFIILYRFTENPESDYIKLDNFGRALMCLGISLLASGVLYMTTKLISNCTSSKIVKAVENIINKKIKEQVGGIGVEVTMGSLYPSDGT